MGIASKEDSKGIFTPCLVNGVATSALVDAGAMCSFISLQLVQENQWAIERCEGMIRQAMSGSETSRIGQVVNVELRNGSRIVTTTMEVANLSGGIKVIIGLDLFRLLGYELKNVPILFPKNGEIDINMDKKLKKKDAETSAELEAYGIGEDGIPQAWRKVLEDNASLPASSTCPLEESEVSINTGDAKPVWIRQYPVPQAMEQKMIRRVDE